MLEKDLTTWYNKLNQRYIKMKDLQDGMASDFGENGCNDKPKSTNFDCLVSATQHKRKREIKANSKKVSRFDLIGQNSFE